MLMMRLLVKIFYSLLGVVKLFYAAAVSYAGMMGLSLTTDNNIMMMYPVVCSQGWQRRRVRAGLLCSISSIYNIYVDTRYLGCDRAQCRTLTGESGDATTDALVSTTTMAMGHTGSSHCSGDFILLLTFAFTSTARGYLFRFMVISKPLMAA